MSAFNWSSVLNDGHGIVLGGTRRGKSALLQLICRAIARGNREGFTLLDLHGECAQAVFEWLANPRNSDPRRPVHFLQAGSAMAFGLNPLKPYDDSPEAFHDAAMVLISAIESWFDASPEQTPRMARLLYCAAHLCARKRLTLLEVLELLTLGAAALRESLLTDFENHVVRRELEDLHTLALKSPRAFLDLVESVRNRLVRLLADRRFARILGQRGGISPRELMDDRAITIVDLSSFAAADGAFLGTLMSTMFVADATRRPALRCARHRLILDEAESMICTETARLVDRSAKFGLSLLAAVQRFGQLRAKGSFIFDALMGNTTLKVCFGGLDYDGAEYIAKNFFADAIDLAEWKAGTERPVATGQSIKTVRSKTDTDQSSSSSGRSHTTGTSTYRAHTRSWMHSDGYGSGTMHSTVENTSQAYSYHDPVDVRRTTIPTGFVAGAGAAVVNGESEQHFSSDSYGESDMEGSSQSESDTTSSSETHGQSHARGESETYVTDYMLMPSQCFSLAEQVFRLTAEIINLPRRHCVVKVEGQPALRLRTADLTPAFQSPTLKHLLLPRFHRLTAERSPYLRHAADVDAEIAARLDRLLAPPLAPEPDFSAAQPMPHIADGAGEYADAFWREHDPAQWQPPGDPPLRIIKGGKDDGDKPHD